MKAGVTTIQEFLDTPHEKGASYKLLSRVGDGNLGIAIFVSGSPEVLEAFEAASEHNPSRYASRAWERLCDLERRSKPEYDVRRIRTHEDLLAAFVNAGLEPVYVQEVHNEYENQPPGSDSPWLLVTTRLGHFKVGWRKRVIILDWEQTEVGYSAQVLFDGENVTMEGKMIHCYGYAKLTDYLKRMRRPVEGVTTMAYAVRSERSHLKEKAHLLVTALPDMALPELMGTLESMQDHYDATKHEVPSDDATEVVGTQPLRSPSEVVSLLFVRHSNAVDIDGKTEIAAVSTPVRRMAQGPQLQADEDC